MQRIFGCVVLVVAAGLTESVQAQAPNGQPNYRVIGSDKNRVAVIDAKGQVEWEVPCQGSSHDVTLLPNGNVLFIKDNVTVVEVNRDKQMVWQYVAQRKPGYTGGLEVHAAQRLSDGTTLVAESGNRRLVEVAADGKIVRDVPLTVDNPHPHRDTRMVRKLPEGTYLVCHEGDGVVREYDLTGKVVWSHKLDLAGRPRSPGHGLEAHGTEVFGAIRLPNGNTLIAAGNGNRVFEVNRDGKTVWSVEQSELPGIKFAWVTTLQKLPNGNVIIGNCHAGPDNPQLVEISPSKEVVWTFKNWTAFGDSLAVAHVLDLPGVIR